MSDGTHQPIETVTPGDKVMSFDGKEAMVSRVNVRDTDHMREIRYRNLGSDGSLRRILTTDEHQFWVMNLDQWIIADFLQVGDRLMLSGGEEAEIIETVRYPAYTTVYNFDVADYETYFANGALVYQECGGQTAARVDERLRAYLNDKGKGILFSEENTMDKRGEILLTTTTEKRRRTP